MKIRGNTVGTNMKPERIIGDIETALDRIIEIQESLINGGGEENPDDANWQICDACDGEYDANQGPCPYCFGGDGE